MDVITDDAGPFFAERAGSIPLVYIVDMCYSGEYNKREMLRKIRGWGHQGPSGTHDCRRVENDRRGDKKAELIYEAQAYQIAKGIASSRPALRKDRFHYSDRRPCPFGHDDREIAQRVGFIAPVVDRAGEYEMEALALGALRILRGERAFF